MIWVIRMGLVSIPMILVWFDSDVEMRVTTAKCRTIVCLVVPQHSGHSSSYHCTTAARRAGIGTGISLVSYQTVLRDGDAAVDVLLVFTQIVHRSLAHG